jgi:hypothetical protein
MDFVKCFEPSKKRLTFFSKIYMIKCGIDSNLYFWHNEGKILLVMIYVDDFIIIRNIEGKITWFKMEPKRNLK